MQRDYSGSFLNIGTGFDQTIRELAEAILEVVGFQGELEFDSSKPDGTPRKLLDVSALNALGWTAQTSLKDGIAVSYKDFQARHPN
jgi:GDP-L-fucose synthase